MEDAMKAMWQCLAVIIPIGASLIGCASSAPSAPAADSAKWTNAEDDKTNWAQVHAVDRVARRYGIEVHWVNYPQKIQP
jgi:hypothetical protein